MFDTLTPGLYIQHVKTGGVYKILMTGLIEKDLTPCCIYRGQDGKVWVRPEEEMLDGRFQLRQYPDDTVESIYKRGLECIRDSCTEGPEFLQDIAIYTLEEAEESSQWPS